MNVTRERLPQRPVPSFKGDSVVPLYPNGILKNGKTIVHSLNRNAIKGKRGQS